MATARRHRGRAGLLRGIGLGALASWLVFPASPFGLSGVRAQVGPIPGPGDTQTIPLEELLNGNRPLSGGVRTRGILEAGPRVPGALRRYSLTSASDHLAATTMSRLSIMPSMAIRDSFDFDADSLNMREVEVVGTFQSGSGGGLGGAMLFWAYSAAEAGNGDKPRPSPTGLLAIEDLVGRPARLAKETVRVRGQFRGKNLFGDLAPAGAPADGWVIKDGDSAVWVAGRRPKGNGWSLDPESKSDATRWVEVVGKIETKDGITFLRAAQVALVSAPKPGDADSQ